MQLKRAFISHISSETDLAQALKERLEGDFLGMLEVFVSSDRRTIQAGARWLEEVDQALKDADVQLVLCSPTSVGRPWVNFEAGAAWLRGIPVIPVCHSGMVPESLPVPLSMLQGVTCEEPGLEKLYDAIAIVLTIPKTPDVDLKAVAANLAEIQRHLQSTTGIESIENPRVLCAASAQYAQEPSIGFEIDVGILRSTFGPGRVIVDGALTRKRLTELLITETFDIVHLVLPVSDQTGDLVFTPVDLQTLASAGPDQIDKLSANGFADLLDESQTRLVVLATCSAMLFAVEVGYVTNVAASDTVISSEAAAEWEDCFYGLLRKGMPLSKSFELTRSQIDVPMRGICRRDVTFVVPDG